MRISVVGTGYVGLVSGACFADMGMNVTCVDIDQAKVQRLREGHIPIFEPGLEPLVKRCVAQGQLHFTTSLPDAMANSNVYFIAVGTPTGEDGSADLQYVLAVAKEIGEHLKDYAVIVDKSTVPVGTADKVRATIQAELDKRGVSIDFDVVSNPEFLKEGAAVDDFMKPDRIVIGTESERARAIMAEVYQEFSRNHNKIMFMGVRDAEMTKYAANAMLATKISFMNEIANLCDAMDVDVEQVRHGIGSDSRIGYSFIYPGCGYGGSCFPKDVKALVRMAHEADVKPYVLDAVEARNADQKKVVAAKTQRLLGNVKGKRIAVWGLAFKPGTDDMREAPSIPFITRMLEAGATVCVHDPEAMTTSKREFAPKWIENGQLIYCNNQFDAVKDADALVLLTEWKQYRQPDFARLLASLKAPVVIDGRNVYNPRRMKALGFTYEGIGRR
ncbi:UDP-glucose dehydrogenase family protein [Simiduia agarivorans]|uniref:UDP-glucose 6-dehydrogenase n=1 Tax=Simiduia agarivorans (strain DSM 21679 / JCM 13881 / BCRC 17597 / SA1) TaxID=1117647 RepID=K4KLW8_SIMAS|nr:UDP-glucose/GDP-mannose dehydrogenase family protein [Simiduia agarivorans]AFU99205.1 UDP-glucose 6-dehydrogenase [Simiduia agarivorans SA1 = DSM 21679]